MASDSKWQQWAQTDQVKKADFDARTITYQRYKTVKEFNVRITKISKPEMDYQGKQALGYIVMLHGVTDDEYALRVGVYADLVDLLTYLPDVAVGKTYMLKVGRIKDELYARYEQRYTHYTRVGALTKAEFYDWYRQYEIVIKPEAQSVEALRLYIENKDKIIEKFYKNVAYKE
jgi:hypothetical protein